MYWDYVFHDLRHSSSCSALVPLSGSIIRQAEYFFDPALSFAEGWNYVYASAISLPAELTAASTIIQFWNTSVNVAVWLSVLGFFILLTNLFFVRIYGELEFTFASLKIMLIIGLNLMVSVPKPASAGIDRYRRSLSPREVGRITIHMAWNFGDILGHLCSILVLRDLLDDFWASGQPFQMPPMHTQGSTPLQWLPLRPRHRGVIFRKQRKGSFGESSSSTVGDQESFYFQNRACSNISVWIVVSIFMVGLIVPSSDPKLLTSTGTASQSPFVIAATRASVPTVPHIINAVVLTSAWSSGNAGMLGGSRVLYGLAREHHAPKLLLRVNRFGIPYLAVCGLGLFMALSYMSVQSTAAKVFTWFQDLVASAALVHWIVICLVYLRFYYGMKKQRISRDELPWKGPLQPYAAWIGLTSFSVIILTGGYAVFVHGDWDTETFFSSYFNIALILTLYVGYKVTKRTKLAPLETMPIKEYLEIAKANPEPRERPPVGWRKLNILWS